MADVTMTTYKQADGEPVGGEYSFVTDLDHFDECWRPVEVVEQVWVQAATRTFWQFPVTVYSCEIEDQEPCDEDAVAWEQVDDDGTWMQVCEQHRTQTDG